jgi:hypothetical protein
MLAATMRVARSGLVVVAVAAASVAASAASAGADAGLGARTAAGAVSVRSYDLGERMLPDDGPLGPLPVRLWGAIGVPDRPGPHPLVIVAHGRHGDGCPIDDMDFPTWPCFATEQRNDLGLRHVVAALARRGLVAVSPDLNGAHTAGWGEPDDRTRWPLIVRRTTFHLVREATEGGGDFGVDLVGRIDFSRIGVLGHSLSGLNAARLALRRADNTAPGQVAGGLGPLESAFLLTPVAGEARLPDLEVAVVLASCDGDTGPEGRRYFVRARRQAARTEPIFLTELHRANHNYFNRTLSQLGRDDAVGMRGRCRRNRRLGASAQQAWLDRAAADFFATTLLEARRPRWLRPRGPLPARAYGRRVTVERHAPR